MRSSRGHTPDLAHRHPVLKRVHPQCLDCRHALCHQEHPHPLSLLSPIVPVANSVGIGPAIDSQKPGDHPFLAKNHFDRSLLNLSLPVAHCLVDPLHLHRPVRPYGFRSPDPSGRNCRPDPHSHQIQILLRLPCRMEQVYDYRQLPRPIDLIVDLHLLLLCHVGIPLFPLQNLIRGC